MTTERTHPAAAARRQSRYARDESATYYHWSLVVPVRPGSGDPSPGGGCLQAMGTHGRWPLVLIVLGAAVCFSSWRILYARPVSGAPPTPTATPAAGDFVPPEPPDDFVADLRARASALGPELLAEELRRRCAENPRDAYGHAALGVLWHVAGRDEEALKALERAADLDTQEGVVYRLLGIYYRDRGAYDDAEEQFRRGAVLEPANPWAFYHLGVTDLALDEMPDAAAAFSRAVQLAPRFAAAYEGLANASFRLNDTRTTSASLRRCLELDPNNALAWDGMGRLHLRRGELDEAEGAYRTALARNVQTAQMYEGLAMVLARGRPIGSPGGEAIALLQRALEIQPAYAEAHAGLGQIYRARGQLDLAASEYRQATALEPRSSEYHQALIAVLYRLGHDAEASELRRSAPDAVLDRRARAWASRVHGSPRDPNTRYELGRMYMELRHYGEAAHQFRVLARLEPRKARAYPPLIQAYEALGEAPQAARARARLLATLRANRAGRPGSAAGAAPHIAPIGPA